MDQPNAKVTNTRHVLICLLLLAGTGFLFWPVHDFEFVGYDDPFYVIANPYVHQGFTLPSLAWAFGKITSGFTYWHPLSWMSHMLDAQLWGMNPGAHHLMSVLYHAINSILLFFLLRKLTGTVWRGAIVAALFAWHPINVESVAWVTERKNLLSTFFLLLTIWTYARYAEESKAQSPKKKLFYALSLFLFACGLMSKPMLVTVPGVLLLLDFWPLRRVFSSETSPGTEHWKLNTEYFPRLLLEKIPFLILSATSAAITVISHKEFESLAEGQLAFGLRISNAFYSYARYLKKMVWPNDLAVIYPIPSEWPTSRLILCVAIFAAISALAIWAIKKRPYITFGWLWFLVTLIPVIGVVQAGAQAMADRFAYVPLIGIFIAIVWSFAELSEKLPVWKNINSVLAIAALAACAIGLQKQLPYWHDSIALFEHSVAIENESPIAHYNLGYAYALQKKNDDAKKEYSEALRITHDYIDAHNNLAAILLSEGKDDEAISHYRDVLREHPNHGNANFNLGVVLERQGKTEEAMKAYAAAVNAEPKNIEFRLGFANALGRNGRGLEAIDYIMTAVHMNPQSAEAQYSAGNAMMITQKLPEALRYFSTAIELKPNYPEAQYNLGTVLAMSGDVPKAAEHFHKAIELKPDFAEAHNSYGMALAETGKKEAAQQEFREALRLANAAGNSQLAAQIQSKLENQPPPFLRQP